MADCETVIVFKILSVLARARDGGQVLIADDIADALPLGKARVEEYLTVLQRARAVRAESGALPGLSYHLTRYGLERCTSGR